MPTEKISKRFSRDEALVEIAEVMAKRGTCNRAKVGAVIARDGRVISTGYVGSPSGTDHCTYKGCEIGPDGGCERTVHAEANAVAFAALHGIATAGSTLFTTHSPCYRCAQLIINSGIQRVVYREEYRDHRGIEILTLAGVETEGLRAW